MTIPIVIKSQSIKRDTIYGENNYKYITVVNQVGRYHIKIENGDTIVFPQHMFLYMCQIDSMDSVFNDYLKTEEYINRDSINVKNLEYLYIKQLREHRGCFSSQNTYHYFIYEKSINDQNSGILCRLGNQNKQPTISFHSKATNREDLFSIVTAINKYMALNDVPTFELPENQMQPVTLSSKDFSIEIIVKEKNKTEIKRTLKPNEDYNFGLHEKFKKVLSEFWNDKLDDKQDFKHLDFINENYNKFQHNEIIDEIKSYVETNKQQVLITKRSAWLQTKG